MFKSIFLSKKTADIYIFSTSFLLTIVGFFSFVGNILAYNEMSDLITSGLSLLAVLITYYAYYIYFRKKDLRYRTFIAVSYIFYFLAMFILSSYNNPPVLIGYCISLIYLALTNLSKKSKTCIIIISAVVHLVIAYLQINQTFPIIVEEYHWLQGFMSILSVNILVIGIIYFNTLIGSAKNPPVTEFIFSFNNNTTAARPDKQKITELEDRKKDEHFKKLSSKYELTFKEEQVLKFFIADPLKTYKHAAEKFGVTSTAIAATFKRISYKIPPLIQGKYEHEKNKTNIIKYFSGNLY